MQYLFFFYEPNIVNPGNKCWNKNNLSVTTPIISASLSHWTLRARKRPSTQLFKHVNASLSPARRAHTPHLRLCKTISNALRLCVPRCHAWALLWFYHCIRVSTAHTHDFEHGAQLIIDCWCAFACVATICPYYSCIYIYTYMSPLAQDVCVASSKEIASRTDAQT